MAETIGNLAVVLTATDKSAATINGMKSNLADVGTSAGKLSGSFGALANTPMFGRLAAQASDARREFGGLARTAAQGLLPIGALGSVSSLATLTERFLDTGRALTSGSRALQMSVPQLHAFRNAASLAGLDAGEATEGLKAFGMNLYDAVGGKNQAIYGVNVGRLAIRLTDASGRARTAADAVGDLADKVQLLNNDPRSQQQFAQAWGIEGLLPILRQGREGLDRWMERGRSMGVMTDDEARRAKRLGDQWQQLRTRGELLASNLGGIMQPALSGVMDQIDAYAKANEKGMGDNLTAGVNHFADATRFNTSVLNGAVNATTGWTGALVVLEGAIANRLLTRLTGLNLAALAWRRTLAGLATVGLTAPAAAALATTATLKGSSDPNATADGVYQGFKPDLRPRSPGDSLAEIGSWMGRMIFGGNVPANGAGGPGAPVGRDPASPYLGSGMSRSTNSASRAAFIAKWGAEARRIAGDLGTSPENILAHWGQETGWGTHEHDNNVGNLQALPGTRGAVVRGDTRANGAAYQAPFFTYGSTAEAANAYRDWIIRHGAPVQGTGNDPVAFGNALRSRGYMENPNAPADIARSRQGLVIPDAAPAPAPAPVSAPAQSPLSSNFGPPVNLGSAADARASEMQRLAMAIRVDFANAPPGTRATSRMEGAGGPDGPLVETSMTGLG